MGVAPVLAHIGGVPVEELLALALTAGGAAAASLRLAWLRFRHPGAHHVEAGSK